MQYNSGKTEGSILGKRTILQYWQPFLLVLAVILTAVCVWNTHLFSTRPLAETYLFDGPSGVYRGEDGRTYVVDTSRRNILILNEEMSYVRTIEGGSTEEGSFYYATAVAADESGIYVADALYSGVGTIIQAERILRFEPDGSGGELLYQIDYPDPDTAPRQYGRIDTLMVQDGQLFFTLSEEHRVLVYQYDLSAGTVVSSDYDFGESYVAFSALDPSTKLPVILAGDTSIQKADSSGRVSIHAVVGEFPYQGAVTEDGTFWFSELNTGALMHMTQAGIEVASNDVFAYYVSAYGNTVCISDGTGVAVYEDGEMSYWDQVPIANAAVRNVMWGLLAACALAWLVLLVLAVRHVVRSWLAFPFFRKIAVVILVAVVASSTVAWYILSTTFREEEATTMAQLEAISDEIVANTNVDLVRRIHSSTDYKGPAYNELKENLDRVIDDGYGRGEYFYYLTYVTDGELIYALMDYEDTVRTWMTYEAYGVDVYTDVFETGEPRLIEGEVSTWGSWTLLLKPVFDENGTVVAVQEVGFNFDNQLRAQRETIFNTILTIFFGAIVLVMLMIEGIYYTEHRRKRRELLCRVDARVDQTDLVPLRTLIFLAFTVDCMQDAFISILASRLYTPFLGIPQSVGAALPISGQVLMAAIFAVLGGFLASRVGAKRVICSGFVIQASGFLLCGLLMNYAGILVGKLLVGSGIGMITVGVNTMAASSDGNKSVETFSGITAGTLVGVSAGSGLGSTILSLVGYRAVFFAGVAILAAGFLLAAGTRNRVPVLSSATDVGVPDGGEEASSIGMVRFLFGKGGTFPFLAMILMPFMSGIYFREYFFPIYSAENGMTETNIGRIYVLCGLLVIYVGPVLTKYLTERLGKVRTVVLTSAVITLASLSFGLLPNMMGALTGVLLVSMAVSCGYTAQSSYYASRPAVAAFGEGRSMGVYSMFDNGGQTLGPILYGYAMLLGYQAGMLFAGCALGALTAAFSLLKRHELAEKVETEIQEETTAC